MTARIMDGKAVSKKVRREVKARVKALAARGMTPGLSVILIGDNAPSQIYVRIKERMCARVGLRSTVHRLPSEVTEDEVLELIDRLNADPTVQGILVQLPVPEHLHPKALIDRIHPFKDVDGLHPMNVGWLQAKRPAMLACTPQGIMRLLREYDVHIEGAHAVVLGRSAIVGRPMSWILLRAHATVTTCHRHTRDGIAHARSADILVSAVGQPGLVTADWVKPGAIVVDVGINRLADGSIVGDVDFDGVREKASLITPVPGGIGPMTVVMLLSNTCLSAERELARRAEGF